MMFNTVLLCVAMVQAIQAILTSDSSNARLEDISSGANAGRYSYPGLLRKVKEAGLLVPGKTHLSCVITKIKFLFRLIHFAIV